MASNVNQIKRNALGNEKEIGSGAFSTVYQMLWQSPDGPINVAAKKFNKKDKHELEVLAALDHPNIVKLIGVVDEGTEFMLILELCEGGSLRSYLKARNGRRLSEKQFFDWAEQASRPLEYLRENKVVHKDVKSDNYMVTSQNILKLGDFGIAKNIDQTVGNATTTASYPWMAPELLLKGVLSPKYDIFALAVVLWELWTLRFPWEGVESQVIAWKVCNENKRLPIPDDCPEPIKHLLRQCWQTDWKKRPDIIQVLKVITSTISASLEARTTSATAASLEARQRWIIAGPWKMVREFGKQDGPGKCLVRHMTLSPDGDVVIASMVASQIKIYNLKGEFKSCINTHSETLQIAVSSDNTCFITDRSQRITMYNELSEKFKCSWESSSLASSLITPRLYGLAIDHAGDLLLGDVKNKYIYKHKQDGTHVASIKVAIVPRYIAVTSQGTIVIADWDTAPQVITSTGEVLHTFTHPASESRWLIYNLYCHDGIIFVTNNPHILCYDESGRYLGTMPIAGRGLALTSDSKTLVVHDAHSVRVFTKP